MDVISGVNNMKRDMINCILKQIWVDVKECGTMLFVVFLIASMCVGILVGMVYIIDWVTMHMWEYIVPWDVVVDWLFIAFVIGIFGTLIMVYLYDKYDKCQYKY